MRVIGLAGWSGAGKTTLVERVLPLLRARGLLVSTLKHAHHHFDMDVPGKDSYRHREAGAQEVLVASSHRWVLLHELRDEAEPRLDDLLRRLSPVDLVLVEGFRTAPHPRIEVHRPSLGKPLLCPGDPAIVAIATDGALPPLTIPVLDLNDGAAAALALERHAAPLDRVLAALA